MVKKKIKRLYRAPVKDSIIGGVCAGFSNYLEVDPTLIRFLWILLTLISFGAGFLGYIIAWIIMPRK